MFRNRPKIGITRPIENRAHLSFANLLISVWLMGGNTKVISEKNIDKLSAFNLDGVLLGGGTDVFPGIFFKEPKENYPYDRLRDEVEIKLIKYAEKYDLPILGICRGTQLLNIVRGGTLHLDIAKLYGKKNYPDTILSYMFFRKPVFISEGSQIHKIFNTNELFVNSLHNQAIDELGDNMVVSARDANGVVQAIEDPQKSFCIGVQFHPERLIYRKAFRNFFREFIRKSSVNL